MSSLKFSKTRVDKKARLAEVIPVKDLVVFSSTTSVRSRSHLATNLGFSLANSRTSSG